MKALILAAGQGTRIRSVHGDRPKCLIRFDHSGWTILDQQIHGLLTNGIRDVGIVVGYEAEQIIRHVATHYPESLSQFRFIQNFNYAKTNNIYSLWLARNWLRGDSFVCLNADVAFHPEILIHALSSAAPVTMIVDRNWRDETMKVKIAGNRITYMSKTISQQDFSATYIGITTFQRFVVGRFLSRIEDLVREGSTQVFFNAAVQQLVREGLHVGYTETAGLPWAEVDDPDDLAFARLHVFPELIRAELAA
jgi:L-glutamine-phosphate cytidylyltransferase